MEQDGMDQWLEANQKEITSIAERIFRLAEVAEEETESMKCLCRYLQAHGFAVETGVGKMPTSLKAVWGAGKPCIGFLGEYDALPGLFQNPVPEYCGNEEAAGHGCGHNLLGTGAVAAAVALRHVMEAKGLKGQVVFYGCPAEEILKGKMVMLEHGCFQELDAALSWHPSDQANPGEISYAAMDSIQFTFTGKSAHAAAHPELGRSGRDAVELMNIAANYLREHVTDDVRIHYAHMDCGEKPNIVPAKGKVWYYVRAKRQETVVDTTNRLIDIAKGAGLMTGTVPDWNLLLRGNHTRVNHTLSRYIYEAMCSTAIPEYTDGEMAFAERISQSVTGEGTAGNINWQLAAPTGNLSYNHGSTDISDVSHVVPVGYFKSVCLPTGVPLHSWMATACFGMGIGQKGMLFAAKVLAKTGLRLMTDSQALKAVQDEFRYGSRRPEHLLF